MVARAQLLQRPFYLDEKHLDWVERTLAAMTQKEKIGQLFCLPVFGHAEALLDEIFRVMQPGGMMCGPMPIKVCAALSRSLAKRSRIPMLFAANLEADANGALLE